MSSSALPSLARRARRASGYWPFLLLGSSARSHRLLAHPLRRLLSRPRGIAACAAIASTPRVSGLVLSVSRATWVPAVSSETRIVYNSSMADVNSQQPTPRSAACLSPCGLGVSRPSGCVGEHTKLGILALAPAGIWHVASKDPPLPRRRAPTDRSLWLVACNFWSAFRRKKSDLRSRTSGER